MRSLARLLTLAVSLIFATAIVAQDGPISADSRELPPPPNPPPLTRELPSDRGRPTLPFRVTFFPPTTPAFGAPISDRPVSVYRYTGRAFDAPEEIADCVNESFYPALGTRLFEPGLAAKTAQRIAAYRALRARLLNDLQNELVVAGATDPAARERELREFAHAQTPRIVALEAEADQLCDELKRGGLFDFGVDWNSERGWFLGDNTTSGIPANAVDNAEFQVLRAAAFFQTGLSPAQRGLLRELALDLQANRRIGRTPTAPAGVRDPLVVFFSPETTRLRLPDTLPPGLRAKFGAFSHDRDGLKRELRDAVVAQDRASRAKRAKVFRDLAEQQWPRFVALDELAESIRREFAAMPPPPLPALPPQLPPALATRISAYKLEMAALERARMERMQSVVAESIHTPGTGLNSPPTADRFREILRNRAERVRQADKDFMAENSDRYAALHSSAHSIAGDLVAFACSVRDPETGQPMDPGTLLHRITTSDQLFAKIGREGAIYGDYRTAMLEPGLSPEQRRLLLGSALVGLAQPLPTGVRMPGPRFIAVW